MTITIDGESIELTSEQLEALKFRNAKTEDMPTDAKCLLNEIEIRVLDYLVISQRQEVLQPIMDKLNNPKTFTNEQLLKLKEVLK